MASTPQAPRITFAIPFYTGLTYLAEAIVSVLEQDETRWNLIVVDDCGPEPAGDLVAGFADPRITYVRNLTNLGLAANWNECVRLAQAPLVSILHADDRYLPGYASAVLAAMEDSTLAVAFTDAVTIDSGGRPTRTLPDVVKSALPRPRGDHVVQGDAGLAPLTRGNYIVCPSMCLRTSIVGTQPFDARLRFVPDWELTTRLLLGGERLMAIRSPLVEYRRHAGSQTTALTLDATRFEEELQLMASIEQRATAQGMARSASVARRRITVRGHLLLHAVLRTLSGRRPALPVWRLLARDVRRPRTT